MSSIKEVLEGKISALLDERSELRDAIQRIEIKIETFTELLNEELELEGLEPVQAVVDPLPVSVSKKRGRPKKNAPSKSKHGELNKQLYEEALSSLPAEPTTEEEAARARRRFHPTSRPTESYGRIKAGTPEDVQGPASTKKAVGHKQITIDDNTPVDSE